MTSVSGVSFSANNSATSIAAAQASLKKLLVLNGVQASLGADGSTAKPTATKVLSTLWTLFDANSDNKITKSDIQTAVENLGGAKSDATALWSQISPYGLNNITKASFDKNSFLKSTVSANIATVQKAFTSYTSSPAGVAEKAMSNILLSNDVLQALASQSSTYVPPTTNQVLSTLWAMFNTTGAKTITQDDVKTAVIAENGKPGDALAIWKQLSPKGAPSLSISQFISSPFLTSVMTANKQTVQSVVSQVQLANAGTSASMLDKFSSSGASMLSGAASGYNDSPIGSGQSNFNYLNLFI